MTTRHVRIEKIIFVGISVLCFLIVVAVVKETSMFSQPAYIIAAIIEMTIIGSSVSMPYLPKVCTASAMTTTRSNTIESFRFPSFLWLHGSFVLLPKSSAADWNIAMPRLYSLMPSSIPSWTIVFHADSDVCRSSTAACRAVVNSRATRKTLPIII